VTTSARRKAVGIEQGSVDRYGFAVEYRPIPRRSHRTHFLASMPISVTCAHMADWTWRWRAHSV